MVGLCMLLVVPQLDKLVIGEELGLSVRGRWIAKLCGLFDERRIS